MSNQTHFDFGNYFSKFLILYHTRKQKYLWLQTKIKDNIMKKLLNHTERYGKQRLHEGIFMNLRLALG